MTEKQTHSQHQQALLVITGWPSATEGGVRVAGMKLKTRWKPETDQRYTFRVFPRSTPEGEPTGLYVVGKPRPARKANGTFITATGSLIRHDVTDGTLAVRISPEHPDVPAFVLTFVASNAALRVPQSASSIHITGRVMTVRTKPNNLLRFYAETAEEVSAPAPERWIGQNVSRNRRRKAKAAKAEVSAQRAYSYETRWRDLPPEQREQLATCPPSGLPWILASLREGLIRRAQQRDLNASTHTAQEDRKPFTQPHILQPGGLLPLTDCLWSPALITLDEAVAAGLYARRERDLAGVTNLAGLSGYRLFDRTAPQRVELSRRERPDLRNHIIIPASEVPESLRASHRLEPLTDQAATQLFGLRQPNLSRLRTVDHFAQRATQLSPLDLYLLNMMVTASLWTILSTALPEPGGRIVRLAAAPGHVPEAIDHLTSLMFDHVLTQNSGQHTSNYLAALYLLGGMKDPGMEVMQNFSATFGGLSARTALRLNTERPPEDLERHLMTLFAHAHSVQNRDTVVSAFGPRQEQRIVIQPWEKNTGGRTVMVVNSDWSVNAYLLKMPPLG